MKNKEPGVDGMLSHWCANSFSEQYAVVADIGGMFMQVSVEPSQMDALRYLFWPNEDLSQELVEYRMLRYLFGATFSPCVASFCLKKTMKLYDSDDPVMTDTVHRKMYFDDLIKSVDTEEVARICVECKGFFNLTKWYSNSKRIMESERAKDVANLETERLPTQSALGLKWKINDDKVVWDAVKKFQNLVREEPLTKRGILSVLYNLFDPLGFLAPFTLKAKLLLQLLTRK